MEQIKLAASANIGVELIPFRKYFMLGALWSDDHPRKGLVDVDKICDRLLERKDELRTKDSIINCFIEEIRKYCK